MKPSDKRVAARTRGVLFSSLVTLAACSGGGGDTSPSVPQQTPQPIQNPNQNPAQTTPNPTQTSSPAPVGVASRIYVTNRDDNSISVYDEEGHLLANCPFAGLRHPLTIAFDPHNKRLYVTSTFVGRVNVFTLAGESINPTGPFTGARELIAFNTNNHQIYTIENTPHAGPPDFAVFDEEGNPVTVSGAFPGAGGDLPIAGITFDPFNNSVYGVLPTNLLFAPLVPQIVAWDEQGNGGSIPNQPADGYGCNNNDAITFDTHNRRFYVLTASKHEAAGTPCTSAVTAFDETGKIVSTTGSFPGLDGGRAITFDANNNRLYVEGGTIAPGISVWDEEGNRITTSGTFPLPSNRGGDIGLVSAPR